MKKALLPVLLVAAVILNTCAQSGTAGIVTTHDVTIPGGQQCTWLRAQVTGAQQTTAYTVGSVTYAPPVAYNVGTPLAIHADDLWSTAVTIPFNFCFFGTAYSSFIVSDNGVVSFNLTHASNFSDWSIPGPIPFSNNTLEPDLLNSIMSPWHEMDPTFQGSIQYYIGGTAPNRFVTISWYNETMYGSDSSVNNNYCSTDYHETQMIVLHETSNIIDIFIQKKDIECTNLSGGTAWNGDLAIEGIYNAAGTVAYSVPGRNATIWSAANDAWRFTPSGANTASTFTWAANGNYVATGDSIMVCPTTATTYQVMTILTGCDGNATTFVDTVRVQPTFTGLVFGTPVYHYPDCVHTGSITAVATGGTAPITYKWSNGQTGATATALTPGTYQVTAYDVAGDSLVTHYQLQNGLILAASGGVVVQPGCGGSLGSIDMRSVPGWNNTDTYVWSTAQTSSFLLNLTAGTYTVTVSDTVGCTASATYVLQASSAVTITASGTAAYCGVNTGEADVVATGGGPFTYIWSNGQTSSRDTDLVSGLYNVTVTNLSGCTATALVSVGQGNSSMVISLTPNMPTCAHDSNGNIIPTVSGGTVPYSYAWSNGEHGIVDTGLAPGVYMLTVTDGNGCHITGAETLVATGSVSPQIRIDGDTDFCSLSATTFTVNYLYGAGSAPSYQWQLNGHNVGTDTSTYTGGNFNNGDVLTCLLTSSDACANPQTVSSAGITIHTNPAPAQDLCLVTTDSTAIHNDVIWEKANKPATDSFFIYRCQTPDTNYVQITAIPRDSLSEYVDATGNPQLGSYRYKINLKDTCGQYSTLSNYIQTVYLQYNGNGNFSWIPYEVENQTSPVAVYQMWCDSNGSGNWFLAESVNVDSNSFTIFSNLFYPNGQYQLRALLGTTCTPTRGNAIIYSNVITHLPTNVQFIPTGAITLLPNPTHNQFEVVNTNTNNNLLSFTMYDEIGNRLQVPYTLTGTATINADISQLAAGMYYVQVNYTNNHAVLKVVKE